MAHTLIQIQSSLFIISQRKVTCSFPFLILKESSYMVFTSTYRTIIFIQSHILRLQMGSTTFKRKIQKYFQEGMKSLL